MTVSSVMPTLVAAFTLMAMAVLIGAIIGFLEGVDIVDLTKRLIARDAKGGKETTQHSAHTGPARQIDIRHEPDDVASYPAILVEQTRKGKVVAVSFNGHRLPFGFITRSDDEAREHERWYKTHFQAIGLIRMMSSRLFGE